VSEREPRKAYSLDGDFIVATAEGALEGDFTVATIAGHVESSDLAPPLAVQVGVDRDAFKAAMRVLPSGVVMVTTRVEGRPWGLTISACCSLTLEPPQILISLRSTTVSCNEILRRKQFGVSILGAEHKSLAERGAAVGVAKFVDEFCEKAGRPEILESPMIAGAVFHLDCTVAAHSAVGDHEVIIGLVESAVSRTDDGSPQPLLYFDRRFWSLGDELV
jgi:flavin reductase ActVB